MEKREMSYSNKAPKRSFRSNIRTFITLTLVTFWELSKNCFKLSNSGGGEATPGFKLSNSGASAGCARRGGCCSTGARGGRLQWGAPHFSNLGTHQSSP